MRSLPATVVSTTLEGPLDWPDATLVSGDAVNVVAQLKEESEVPLRSHGSLSMNRALMAAGLVGRVQVTLFPVITGQTGLAPVFGGLQRRSAENLAAVAVPVACPVKQSIEGTGSHSRVPVHTC